MDKLARNLWRGEIVPPQPLGNGEQREDPNREQGGRRDFVQ